MASDPAFPDGTTPTSDDAIDGAIERVDESERRFVDAHERQDLDTIDGLAGAVVAAADDLYALSDAALEEARAGPESGGAAGST